MFGFNSLLLVILATIVTLNARLVQCDLYCPLVWESNGYGHTPDDIVRPVNICSNSSSSNFNCGLIARVYIQEKWIVGTLIPSQGQITLLITDIKPELTRTASFSFYQVLTNPHNCILQWIQDKAGHVPSNAVPVAVASNHIGRATVQGALIAGPINKNGLILVTRKDSVVHQALNYEVLVSVYPKLDLRLTKFRYTNLDLTAIRAATRKELIHGELVSNLVNDVQMSTTISHSKLVHENFELIEEKDWLEIGTVSLAPGQNGNGRLLWFGTNDLQLENFQVNGRSSLGLNRTRDIVITRTINLNTRTDIQVCSILDTLEDYKLDFESAGEFRLPGIANAGIHVEDVLKHLGRVDVLEVLDDYVLATVHGQFNGKYVTSTTMENSAPEKLGPCVQYIS